MTADKIKELLGLGLTGNVVAAAVGVTDGYVSQLLSDEKFAAEVSELRTKNLASHAARDRQYNELEDTMLARLREQVETGLFFTKPSDVLKAITVLNAAKRRAAPAELSAHSQGAVVPLVLPVVIAPRIEVNPQGQVIEVGGQTLATMGAKQVNEELNRMKSPEGQKAIEDKRQELLAQDAALAADRLANLKKMETLPVHELL